MQTARHTEIYGQPHDREDATDGAHPLCESCKYWDTSSTHRDDDNDSMGMCRRQPPTFDERTALGVWPFTEDKDWCGAWAPE